MKEKVLNALENLACKIPKETSCGLLWGDVEMPEQLRERMRKENAEED